MADNDFDEKAYREQLIRAGLDPATAAEVAAKTTAGRATAAAAAKPTKATPKKKVVPPSGLQPIGQVLDLPPLESKPAKPTTTRRNNKPESVDFSSRPVPAWVQEVIEAHLAIEAEDAKSAKQLGFMARALVIATMPYKDPKADVFKRKNGDFSLRIVAGYEGGIPYGIYPRLLMSWVSTEAVRKESPIIELGDSLRLFLRDVLGLQSGGGKRGSSTRVSEQMKRLFGSLITAKFEADTPGARSFNLENVLIAQSLRLDEVEMQELDAIDGGHGQQLWTPQERHEAGTWRSKVRLTDNFFLECIKNPVPIDLRAYRSLRRAPMAMDIYTWLTYRMSYTQRRSKPIRWEALMLQFGSGYGTSVSSEAGMKQAVLDFKRAFLSNLKLVQVVYPQAQIDVSDAGLVLLPSPSHVLPSPGGQGSLF